MALPLNALTPSVVARLALGAALLALCLSAWTTLTQRIRLRRFTRVLDDAQLAGALRNVDAALPELRRRLDEAASTLATLNDRTLRSLSAIGLVHFRAYETDGPMLSFSLAILDGRRDGVVITNLYGRHDSRVYTKHVSAGTATSSLGPEEGEALRLALAGGGTAAWEGGSARRSTPRA